MLHKKQLCVGLIAPVRAAELNGGRSAWICDAILPPTAPIDGQHGIRAVAGVRHGAMLTSTDTQAYMQALFNNHVFNAEKEAFDAEGLTPSHVAFRDNADLLSVYTAESGGLVALMHSGQSSLSRFLLVFSSLNSCCWHMTEACTVKFSSSGFSAKVEAFGASKPAVFSKSVTLSSASLFSHQYHQQRALLAPGRSVCHPALCWTGGISKREVKIKWRKCHNIGSYMYAQVASLQSRGAV